MAIGIPEPHQTPKGPAYEGRLLDRPDEEIVDQGIGFDVRTLMTRRTALSFFGLGAGATLLAACTSTGSTAASSPISTATPSLSSSTNSLPSAEIPDETAGPYPGDGSNGPDVLAESGIERTDIRSSIGADDPVPGVPLDVTFTITNMADGDAAFAGVAVYAWHCDAQGRYSMYSQGVEDESWLRGVQVADAEGQVTFTSVVPGCYAGRWTHIHFEVYPDLASISDADNAIATSQMAFPQEVLNEVYQLADYSGSARNLAQISLDSDNVFADDSAALQMATISGNSASGYTASLVIRVDTATEPTGGGAPGGVSGGEGPGRP